MDHRIIIFAVGLVGVLWLLRLFPRSSVARIAFSWFGPVPRDGESWAKYQLRWAFYSLDWLSQIAVLFAALFGAVYLWPSFAEHQLFQVAGFALSLAGVTALVAALAFLTKAGKARYLGPNPVYGEMPNEAP